MASPKIKQNPNELALHQSAPQLPQQQAKEPAKRPEKKPKKRSKAWEPELGIWVLQLSGTLMREVTVVHRF